MAAAHRSAAGPGLRGSGGAVLALTVLACLALADAARAAFPGQNGNRKPITRRGDDAVGSTTLRRLPKGRFRVRVRAQTRDGRFVETSKRYRSCRG